jgi:hypothetical protein
LQSFGELIAQWLDLFLSAIEIHLVRLDLRFQVLDLTDLACSCRAVQALVDIEQSCSRSEKKEATSCF